MRVNLPERADFLIDQVVNFAAEDKSLRNYLQSREGWVWHSPAR